MEILRFCAVLASLLTSLVSGRVVLPGRDVCYTDVGCFHPFNGFNAIFMVPDKPEKVNTKFLLFTRSTSKDNPLVLDYLDNSTLEVFDESKKTVFLTHGAMESSQKPHHVLLRETLLSKFDMNVVMVDWKDGADSLLYVPSAINTQLVGRQIARLVQLLNERRGLSPKNVHLVGLSLGGETSGFAGKWYQKIANNTIGRITPLDPAGTYFQFQNPEFHVNKTDADFVDVIHCSVAKMPIVGDFGLLQAIGDVDFYPNGGRYQPLCSKWNFFEHSLKDNIFCSHESSVAYFIESILDDCSFASKPCPEIDSQFKTSNYWTKECTKPCDGECGRMGYYSDQAPGRGPHYLTTNDQSPYCQN